MDTQAAPCQSKVLLGKGQLYVGVGKKILYFYLL